MFGLFGGGAMRAAGRFASDREKDRTARERNGVVAASQGPQPARPGLFGRARNFLQSERDGVSNLDRIRLAGAYMRDDPSFAMAAERGLEGQRAQYQRQQEIEQAQSQENTALKLEDYQSQAGRERRRIIAEQRGYAPEVADMYINSPDDFYALARNNNEAFTLSDGQERFGGAFGSRVENPDEMLPFNQRKAEADIANIQSQIEDRAEDNRRADVEEENSPWTVPQLTNEFQQMAGDAVRKVNDVQFAFEYQTALANGEPPTNARDGAMLTLVAGALQSGVLTDSDINRTVGMSAERFISQLQASLTAEGTLGETARTQLFQVARDIERGANRQISNAREYVTDIATRNNINPSDIPGLVPLSRGEGPAGMPGPYAPQFMPESDGFYEGQTATNPETGERIVYRNGRWQSQ